MEFKHPHTATDFSSLTTDEVVKNRRWLPSDMDGITHRRAEAAAAWEILTADLK